MSAGSGKHAQGAVNIRALNIENIVSDIGEYSQAPITFLFSFFSAANASRLSSSGGASVSQP